MHCRNITNLIARTNSDKRIKRKFKKKKNKVANLNLKIISFSICKAKYQDV